MYASERIQLGMLDHVRVQPVQREHDNYLVHVDLVARRGAESSHAWEETTHTIILNSEQAQSLRNAVAKRLIQIDRRRSEERPTVGAGREN